MNESFKYIQTDQYHSLNAAANKFNLYYKCHTIAYWLMTSYEKKENLRYNICSKTIQNQRIKIESSTNHAILQVYLNDSLKVKYHFKKLLFFKPTEILLEIIDLLFKQALKEKKKY